MRDMNRLENSHLEARSGNFETYASLSALYAELGEQSFENSVVRRRSVTKPDKSQWLMASFHASYNRALEQASETPPHWTISFTPTFKKAIAAADRKLQGRILQALPELTEAPTTAHGDTKKPLSGDLKGLWRYRFGDYRLVYEPRTDLRTVVLVDFASRGEIYG